jgi:hypothetical protein
MDPSDTLPVRTTASNEYICELKGILAILYDLQTEKERENKIVTQ